MKAVGANRLGPVTKAAIAAALATGLITLAGCGSAAPPASAAHVPAATAPAHGTARPGPGGASIGTAGPAATAIPAVYDTGGHYQVGQRWLTFIEPPRGTTAGQAPSQSTGQPAAQPAVTRKLLTQLIYPLQPAKADLGDQARAVANGPRPLIVFAPGFMQCGHPYWQLLSSWASAGYVVAVVNFPHADCLAGAAATETDMVNQPADVSFVIASLLSLNAAPSGSMAGLLNPDQIGIAGQSDGGDTVAAIAANTCCADTRVKAVAVLSGAEWPQMPGGYFRSPPVPMLFTQGSTDTMNPPILSVTMYQRDPSARRYYLNLIGADHTTPYWGTNPAEQAVAQVTLDFFNRYLLDRITAGQAIVAHGNVPGVASLVSGQQSAP